MKNITINFEDVTVKIDNNKKYKLSDSKGFALVGDAWLRAGWDAKYPYSFTWLGRPIIQQPEDMIRIQEIIWKIKPDIIIETGIAHGGSLIYYASLMSLLDYCEYYTTEIPNRHVIGIDIDIRQHNKVAIEQHPMFSYITTIEGSSVNYNIFNRVKNMIKSSDKVFVILDSNHTKEHVLKELELYSSLVSLDSYIVACDGYIKELVGKDNAPRSLLSWKYDNPKCAAEEFVKNNPNFIIEEPKFQFNEGSVDRWISYFSGGFLKRIK